MSDISKSECKDISSFRADDRDNKDKHNEHVCIRTTYVLITQKSLHNFRVVYNTKVILIRFSGVRQNNIFTKWHKNYL